MSQVLQYRVVFRYWFTCTTRPLHAFCADVCSGGLGSSGARQLRWFQGGVAQRAWQVDRLGHERVDASQVRAHF